MSRKEKIQVLVTAMINEDFLDKPNEEQFWFDVENGLAHEWLPSIEEGCSEKTVRKFKELFCVD